MSDWIKWNGGPMPVDGEQFVVVKKCVGVEVGGEAKDFDWHWLDGEYSYFNIVAYRVLSQNKKDAGVMEVEQSPLTPYGELMITLAAQSNAIAELTRENEKLKRWVDNLINALGK